MAQIPLAALTRAAGVRRSTVTLTPIIPTKAQADQLARAYLSVLRVWSEGWNGPLRAEYVASLEEARRADAMLTRDSALGLQAIIERLQNGAVEATIRFTGLARAWGSVMSAWHLRQFVSKLLYSTKVDLSSQLTVGDTFETVETALTRNVALVRNVSDELRGRISDIVLRGLQQRTPVRDVAKQINEAVQLGRARSLRIASDQTVKLSAALDRERQLQVGMTSFEWMHSGKLHPRLHHLQRDKKVFAWSSEVAKTDPPGYAPFCGCKARGVLQVDGG